MTEPTEMAMLVLMLGRLERLNEAFVTDLCREHGITPSELRVLAMLRHGRDDGPVRPTVISQWVVQTSGGLTATLRRLETDALVERIDDQDDRRVRLVALTETGRQFYDDVLDELSARYADALTELDIEVSLGAVRELVTALERSHHVASSAGWRLRPPPPSPAVAVVEQTIGSGSA